MAVTMLPCRVFLLVVLRRSAALGVFPKGPQCDYGSHADIKQTDCNIEHIICFRLA